jgi:hypothetical protein
LRGHGDLLAAFGDVGGLRRAEPVARGIGDFFGVGLDHHQQVVEVVGHASRQPAYGFHLLRLAQLLFQHLLGAPLRLRLPLGPLDYDAERQVVGEFAQQLQFGGVECVGFRGVNREAAKGLAVPTEGQAHHRAELIGQRRVSPCGELGVGNEVMDRAGFSRADRGARRALSGEIVFPPCDCEARNIVARCAGPGRHSNVALRLGLRKPDPGELVLAVRGENVRHRLHELLFVGGCDQGAAYLDQRAQRPVQPPELGFHPAAIGQVNIGLQDEGGVRLAICAGSPAAFYHDLPALACRLDDLAIPRAGVAQRVLWSILGFRESGPQQLRALLALRIEFLPAVEPFGAAVPQHDAVVGVLQDHGFLGDSQKAKQGFGAFPGLARTLVDESRSNRRSQYEHGARHKRRRVQVEFVVGRDEIKVAHRRAEQGRDQGRPESAHAEREHHGGVIKEEWVVRGVGLERDSDGRTDKRQGHRHHIVPVVDALRNRITWKPERHHRSLNDWR